MKFENLKKKPWYKTFFITTEFYFWSLFCIFPPIGFMILYFRYGEIMEPSLFDYYEIEGSETNNESC